jgi:hypothetical protein
MSECVRFVARMCLFLLLPHCRKVGSVSAVVIPGIMVITVITAGVGEMVGVVFLFGDFVGTNKKSK